MMLKRMLGFFGAFIMVCVPVSVMAVTITGENGSGTINVTVEPTVISAVVPTSFIATIKPNGNPVDYEGDKTTDATDTFISPQATITNNTNAPVTVAISSIKAKTGSPGVVSENTFTNEKWMNIDKAQTANNIAFGFKAGGLWKSVTTADGWYGPSQTYTFGAMNRKSSVTVDLKAKYGLAVDSAKTYQYDVIYKLSLA